jgi:hypothetical protein
MILQIFYKYSFNLIHSVCNKARLVQFMVALHNLQTIYVRGSYGPSPQSQARLQTVKLETTQVSSS